MEIAERYDVCTPDQDRKDPDKTHWTPVGTAFPMRNKGGFKVIFRDHVSIGGECVLFPVTPKSAR